MKRPLAVALTGGIAAGKSEALAAFARHGAETASADEIVHALLAEDHDVRAAIAARWGSDADDRRRIAAIVFDDPDELAWLEQLLHPRVRDKQAEWLETVTAPLAVIEVPLLFETGAESRFDAVVTITAARELREGRRGDGLSKREARLLPDEEKIRRADFAYVNDGPLAELDAFVAGVVHTLTSS